jgi:hypothetical protein
MLGVIIPNFNPDFFYNAGQGGLKKTWRASERKKNMACIRKEKKHGVHQKGKKTWRASERKERTYAPHPRGGKSTERKKKIRTGGTKSLTSTGKNSHACLMVGQVNVHVQIHPGQNILPEQSLVQFVHDFILRFRRMNNPFLGNRRRHNQCIR